jgi:hypothetical protein
MESISYSALDTYNVWVNVEVSLMENDGIKTTYSMEIFSYNRHIEPRRFKLYIDNTTTFKCGYFYKFNHRNVEKTKTYCKEEKYKTADGEEKILWNTLQK